MTILVTGATGLVGNNVTRRLLAQGRAVRVLVRAHCDPRPLAGLAVEFVQGDVRDPAAVRRACRGVSAVIHSAALVHLGWTRLDEQREINVEGTRHVAAAAMEEGVRMVLVSSVDALAVGRRDQPADEDTPREGQVPCGYVLTKREAEAVVQQHVAQGLQAPSGRMLLAVARQFTPLAPVGGGNACDVRDVADGILAALERGVTGRNYILGGDNLPYADLWRLMAEITGGTPPWARAGPLLRVLGGRGGDLWGKLTGREPDVNSASITMSSQFHYYTSDRARTELGYYTRPLRETIADAWQWFLDHGYVRR
jgi:dihydroflavonol-4-reductase